MNPRTKKWVKFVLRWGIAVGGIAWVLMNTSFRDRVTTLGPDNLPVARRVLGDAGESDGFFRVPGPAGAARNGCTGSTSGPGPTAGRSRCACLTAPCRR